MLSFPQRPICRLKKCFLGEFRPGTRVLSSLCLVPRAFFLPLCTYIHPSWAPKTPQVPSSAAEHLATAPQLQSRLEGRALGYQQTAQSGSEADPSSTSGIGLCESHPETRSGVSPGGFLQHGVWCAPRLTPPVAALPTLPIPVPCVDGKVRWAWSRLPSLFSSSSLCRPSSLFLFLFCCRSNSSWTFSVLPERYLPPFSCVALSPHPSSLEFGTRGQLCVYPPHAFFCPSDCDLLSI